MELSFQPYSLKFKFPGGTSRGVLHEKQTYLLRLELNNELETEFIGECALFRGLSADDTPEFEDKLIWVCSQLALYQDFPTMVEEIWDDLILFPSIRFGLEQIVLAIKHYGSIKPKDEFNPILFPSDFTNGTKGITINGLIWMGNSSFMEEQINTKLNANFHCIKLKIGVNWDEEKKILQKLRKKFTPNELELRVDANGAFNFEEAKAVLNELAELDIHSIEQPIRAGQMEQMAELCAHTPTPIALDEELIGVFSPEKKVELLEKIKPQFIILKPSLVGGFTESQSWIHLAERQNCGWWITSALESNIGLNAIAQWTYTLHNPMAQGLGTGGLFKNNFHSRLKLVGEHLFFV